MKIVEFKKVSNYLFRYYYINDEDNEKDEVFLSLYSHFLTIYNKVEKDSWIKIKNVNDFINNVEKYSKEAYEQYPCDWLFAVVADAKTGAILGSTSYPSFNPNIKNITNYLNPLVSFAIEPGSTMKIFTYMATMEKKMYDGNKTFKSFLLQPSSSALNGMI